MRDGKNSNFPLLVLLLIAAIQLSKQFMEFTVTVMARALHMVAPIAEQAAKNENIRMVGSVMLLILSLPILLMLILGIIKLGIMVSDYWDRRIEEHGQRRKSQLAAQHTVEV